MPRARSCDALSTLAAASRNRRLPCPMVDCAMDRWGPFDDKQMVYLFCALLLVLGLIGAFLLIRGL